MDFRELFLIEMRKNYSLFIKFFKNENTIAINHHFYAFYPVFV
jgi:hypothetical protein